MKLKDILLGKSSNPLTEGKNVKALKADYEKAVEKEQQLSSLMLQNLVKYKQAKASGDEKAVAKHTKIAGQLSPKKKAASDIANNAYQAYEDKISGLHADAELEIDENINEASRKDSGMSSSVSKRRAGAELKQKLAGKRSDGMGKYTATIYGMNGSNRVELKSLNDLNKFSKFELDENTTEDYKYKKYASKAFEDINDAMFNFRHSMGIKTLTNKDMKLKKKVDSLHQALFDLQKEMRSNGLTEVESEDDTEFTVKLSHLLKKHVSKGGEIEEGSLNEMDINDPVLVAMRAFKNQLKKDKSKPPTKKISMNKYYKLMDMESDLIDQMRDAAKELKQLDSDMNAEAGQKGDGWSDADANRYGGDLDKLQTKYEKLAKQKAKVKKAIMDYRIS